MINVNKLILSPTIYNNYVKIEYNILAILLSISQNYGRF